MDDLIDMMVKDAYVCNHDKIKDILMQKSALNIDAVRFPKLKPMFGATGAEVEYRCCRKSKSKQKLKLNHLQN